MEIKLPFVPERSQKPRNHGLNMVMDKGLSLRQVEDLLDTSQALIDFVKLGFGTSLVYPKIKEKLQLYKSAGIKPYLGGTLFEAFVKRNKVEDYLRLMDAWDLDVMEVSDGSIRIAPDLKCELIHAMSKRALVLSEVGSKEEGILIAPNKWKQMMQDELSAGAWKVIAEARESGTVGIYRPSGKAHTQLINKILGVIEAENIIWEAPQKPQQVFWIKLLGANVNLGNIAPEEVIPLETLRQGLRGDTFFHFLPKDLAENEVQSLNIPDTSSYLKKSSNEGVKRKRTKTNAG